MMFYTSDKLTSVFECIMFVSQFHVHCKIGILIHCITFDSISNENSYQMSAKKNSKAFACLSTKDYFEDYVNKPVRMHQGYFYSLRCIILRLKKEVIGSGLENTFQNHEKEHSGHDKNNFFFYSIFYFITFFFNALFFPLLQQFTAGENLRVAGDSAGCQRILTTLYT